MQSLSPVKSNEREIFMDVLRGFAILGIFIANLHVFSGYGFGLPPVNSDFLLPGPDKKMQFLHYLFIEGKFYSIFSFLFGWGIALQLQRASANGQQSLKYIRRRLFFMLLLGAFHLLLWPGDIVFFYALVGFLLLPFRKLSDKGLLVTGIILVLSPILLYGLKMLFPVLASPSMVLYDAGGWMDMKIMGVNSDETYLTFMQNADWIDIIKSNLGGFFYRFGDLFFQSRISKVLGMMLIGMAAGRTQFYRNIARNKKALIYIIVLGCVIALPANYILARFMELKDGSYYQFKTNGMYRTIAYACGVAPLAAVYIASFMLIFNSSVGKKILSFLAPVGKMAFSNYIMHTIIGSIVFLPAGLGYMGTMGPVFYTIFALLVFLFQIIISTIWLSYFNYGPLEWLWRSATYGKWQKFKKQVTDKEKMG